MLNEDYKEMLQILLDNKVKFLVVGAYVDKNGVNMLDDGGSLLLKTKGQFIGPGHAGIFSRGRKHWLSCHFYDGTRRGAATLAIRPLQWNAEGWPEISELINQ